MKVGVVELLGWGYHLGTLNYDFGLCHSYLITKLKQLAITKKAQKVLKSITNSLNCLNKQ